MTSKSLDECFDLFEDIAMTSYQSLHAESSHRGVMHVDSNTAIAAQMEALARIVKDLQMKSDRSYEICKGGHNTADCQMTQEQVEYLGNQICNNSYGNSGWRNNPGSNWRSNQNQSLFQNSGQGSREKKDRFDEMMAQLLEHYERRYQESAAKFKEHDTMIQSQRVALQNLERHVGEIAEMMKSRKEGNLPSNTDTNPGHSRQFAKAVTTRSGQGAETPRPVVDDEDEPVDEEIEIQADPGKVHERRSPGSPAQPEDSTKKATETPVREYKPPFPYLGRHRREKEGSHYQRFLSVLRKLHINIPFVEALSSMPKYAKYLKDMLTNKTKL
ncbi:hypothetical protein L1987_45626 [Smallanthus sonchifolius]|uniref:Uncharacterized protein n=1 Tax=Smallanthus sonchifolius TaxID=185202 RepID=A0ACB9FYH0_9ASTR|nr:hypothetical protein L1987_45626 [Smallanthus sonchifolius]